MYDCGMQREGSLHSAHDDEDSELVTIRRFGNMSEALAAQGFLDAAGIESFLADTNIARVEWPITRGMRLQVDSKNAEAAIALLAEPDAASTQ
jgi:hypothetical protein